MTNQINSSSALTSQLSAQFTNLSLNESNAIFTLIKSRNIKEIQHLAAQNKLILSEKNSEGLSVYEEIEKTLGEPFALSLLSNKIIEVQGFDLLKLLMGKTHFIESIGKILFHAEANNFTWWNLPENKFNLFKHSIAQKNENVALLCVSGLDANTIYSTYDGKTLLMLSAEAGFKKCIHVLLLAGAALDTTDTAHKPAWLYLLTYEKSFLLALERSVSIKKVGTPLLVRQLLIEKQHALAENFIKGLFSHVESENPDWWKNKAQRASLLGWALETGALPVAALLKESATLNVHIESLGRKTPLMLAAKAQQSDLVLEFVRKGALLTPKDNNNTSGIEYIVKLGSAATQAVLCAIPTANKAAVFELLDFLLEKELFKELDFFLTHNLCAHQPKWLVDLGQAGFAELLPFFMGCGNKEFSLSTIKSTSIKLLDTSSTKTPLLLALKQNWDDIVLLLVSKGILLVSENIFHQNGWDAIEEHYSQRSSAIEELLRALPLKEKSSEHLFHFLATTDKFARVASLHSRIESLSAGDQPTWWNTKSKTDLFFRAASKKCKGFCSLLLNDINVQGKDSASGSTPLMVVASNAWSDLAVPLIKHGNCLTECDSFGKTVCTCLKEISETFLYTQIETLLGKDAITADTMTFFIQHSISEDVPDGAVALFIARKLQALSERDQPTWWKSNKEQFLATACSCGFAAFVFLIHGTRDINAPIGENQTTLLELTVHNQPFIRTAYNKNKQFLELLLGRNATILTTNRAGKSCWDLARAGIAPLEFVSLIPLSSRELVDFLHICIKQNEWDAFFAIIERCRLTPPSWWNTATIQNTLETALIPHLATLSKNQNTLPLLLNLSWKQAVVCYVNTVKETFFTSVAANTLQTVFEKLPLDSSATFELLSFLVYKHPTYAEQLLKLLSVSPPSWMNNEDKCAELFCWATISKNKPIADYFFPKIAFAFFKRVDDITLNPFLCAATNEWDTEATKIAFSGAKLTYTDTKGLTGYDWIAKRDRATALKLLNILPQPALARFIADTPLTEDQNIRLLITHCIPKHPEVLLQLVTRVVQEKPTWWVNTPHISSALFQEAVTQNWRAIANLLIPSLYLPNQHHCYGKNDKTALMLVAEKKWESEVIAFFTHGFPLIGKDDSNRVEWKYIEKNFSIEFLNTQIAKTYKLDRPAQDIINFVISCLSNKRSVLVKTLITRVKNLPVDQQPAWFKDPTIGATLLCIATVHSCKPVALLLLNHANLNTLNPGFDNKSPLALAIDQGWEDVVEALITLDAPLALPATDKKDWLRLTEKFGKPFLQKMLLKVPMSSENSYSCLKHMICARSEFAELFLDIARQKNSSWYTDKKKMAYLFSWAAHGNNKLLVQKIVPLIDVNFVDPDSGSGNYTPLFYAAQFKWDDIVLALIAMGAKLHATNTLGQTAFEHIQQKCTTKTYTQVLEELNLDSSDIYYLLLTLVKRSHTDATTLFTQVLTKTERPHWWSKTTATELFFAASQALPIFAPRLIPFIDVTKADSSHLNRTALMIAAECNLAAEHINTLIKMGSSFAHKDSRQMSALELLLRRGIVAPSNSALLAFLHRCGVDQSITQNCSTADVLFRKLKTEKHSLFTQLVLSILFNEMDRVRKYFDSLSSCQERIALISKIGSILGPQAAEEVIDLAFRIDPNHYKIAIASQEIPAKDPKIDISRALLSLYEQYGELKTPCREEALQRFASKVTQRVAYIGTPLEKSKALEVFYTTIDNATCGSIKAIVEAISALEKNGKKPFLTLVKDGYASAEKLYTDIQNFLKEYADAAPNCGGRLMNTAVQQYSYIVHNQVADIRTAILMHAAELRAHISTSLFPVDAHSVHAHTLFLQRFGKRYNIPGAAFLEGFDDIFSHSRENAVTQAEGKFLKDYSPICIVQYLKTALRENPYHDQFMSLLPDLIPEGWQEAQAKEIIEELSKQFGSTITSENKSAIQKYLAAEPFVLTLSNADVESYATVGTAIVKNDLLPMALNRDGKSFSLASILLALLKFNILK